MKITLTLLLFILSCTKEEPKYDKFQLYNMAKKADKSFELLIPSGVNTKLVDCHIYRPKCLEGHKAKVKKLEFAALKFKNEKDAMAAAKFIDGYYIRNWAFDFVKGEPILERYVQRAFKAKLP